MRRPHDSEPTRLPLVPLPDFVLFPQTELRLAFTAADQEVVEQVLLPCGREGRSIGTVLLKPTWARDEAENGAGEVFSSGTAGRLVAHEPTDEGGCRILLRGEFRFEVTEHVGGTLLPEAIVERLPEPFVSDVDPDVMALRDELARILGALSRSQAEPMTWAEDLLLPEDKPLPFEGFVNRVAAGIDATPLRKLSLLADSLPQRANNLLSILRSRHTLLLLLQPYQHLARGAEFN